MREYGWDSMVSFTAAAFPWMFCALYFGFVMAPRDAGGNPGVWKTALLGGSFDAPPTAGVLFPMLGAGGLGGTWLFQKARVLAIFDDLATILLLVPLKMMLVGLRW